MVYETAVPPVPNRVEDKLMINKIKKSFQDQPYYKYYMNEGVRLSKMDHAQDLKDFTSTWWSNFLRGLFFSSIIIMPLSHLYKKASFGIPMYYTPGRYSKPYNDSVHWVRQCKQLKVIIPGVYLFAYLYATHKTSIKPITDEYFERKKLKLPY